MDELNYSPFAGVLTSPERVALLPELVTRSNELADNHEAAAVDRKHAKDVLFSRDQDYYHPRVEYTSTNGRDAAADRALAEEREMTPFLVGVLGELDSREVAAILSARGDLDFLPPGEREAFVENVTGTMGYLTHPDGLAGWRKDRSILHERKEEAEWNLDNALGAAEDAYNAQVLQVAEIKRTDPELGQALEEFNRLREHAVVNEDPRAYAALAAAYGALGLDGERMRAMEAAMAANLRDALSGAAVEEPNEVSDAGAAQGSAVDVNDERDSDERYADLYERFEREHYGSEAPSDPKTPAAAEAQPKKRDPKAIPDYFENRFVKMGASYVDWENGRRTVLIDRGTSLRASRNYDNDSIKAIMDVAEARGWTSVKLRGTEEFRRAAYFEAASRGLQTVGYAPTDAERTAAREAAERNGKVNSVHREEAPVTAAATKAEPASSTSSTKPAPSKAPGAKATQGAATAPAGPSPGPKGPDSAQKPQASSRGEPAGTTAGASGAGAKKPIAGTLLEHGEAKYQFDEKKTPSYYLKLKAPNGEEKILWGVDFPRALSESSVQIGDQVEAQSLGKKAVTVLEPVLNDKGEVIGEKPVETHRTEWRVTPFENELARAYRDARDIETQREASKDHPSLTNAFALKAAATKFFNEHATVADRPRFLAAIDKRILQDLRDGVAIKDVMIRGEKSTDRQQQVEEAHER